MKGDPSIQTNMRAKDSFLKIKDLYSVECHIDMKDT